MNLRCMYCQTPFTLSMNEKIGALRLMHTENMHHYDAVCPRCRRANSVSRERLEMFTPGWQQAIAAPAPVPQTETPPAAPALAAPKGELTPAPVASHSKQRHAPAAKKAEQRPPAKSAAKPKAKAKPVGKPKAQAKSSATKSKPSKSKPVAKKSTAKAKKK